MQRGIQLSSQAIIMKSKSNPEENSTPAAETRPATNPAMTDEQDKIGEIRILTPVVENMVKTIVLDLPGVIDVVTPGANSISGFFGKTETRSAVRVVEDEAKAYAIEIRVALEFGVNLAQIAHNIQTTVLAEIVRMTSHPVSKVDVYIERVEKASMRKAEDKQDTAQENNPSDQAKTESESANPETPES